jgi:hypothetical protein
MDKTASRHLSDHRINLCLERFGNHRLMFIGTQTEEGNRNESKSRTPSIRALLGLRLKCQIFSLYEGNEVTKFIFKLKKAFLNGKQPKNVLASGSISICFLSDIVVFLFLVHRFYLLYSVLF